ncbi:hypothetical protein Barb7_01384 [Bacteroidales bacterium Barb7]|nr:hypothetical protein Barb7_01384 [Bacteroidales bacterium Barb7]
MFANSRLSECALLIMFASAERNDRLSAVISDLIAAAVLSIDVCRVALSDAILAYSAVTSRASCV